MVLLVILISLALAFVFTTLTALVVVVMLLLPTRYISRLPASKDVSVQVLVLGDIGRSPRMQYHALSVAKHGGRVSLVGYQESSPHPDILASPRIQIYPLPPPPAVLKSRSLPFIISGPLKVIWQVYTLFKVLGVETNPAQWLLVQNPPSIPTLVVAMIISFLRNTRLLIDWHNYGWTILSGTKGPSHPFVKVSKIYECIMARFAPSANLTVTEAMSRQLQRPPYGVKTPILTLHDRPAAIFQPINSLKARKEFLKKLPQTQDHASAIVEGTTRLIVSSTSWTPDEDFSLLLDALVKYVATGESLPIIAIITGMGPQKAMYEARIKALEKDGKLVNVRVVTAWLSYEDYATLLACADLGICLHMSSSGVDLPMKVVDMFGAGLPVAAYSRYESFAELVKEGVNGCGFETASELAKILLRLLALDSGDAELKHLRAGAVKEGSLRWDEEWDRVVGRLIGVIHAEERAM